MDVVFVTQVSPSSLSFFLFFNSSSFCRSFSQSIAFQHTGTADATGQLCPPSASKESVYGFPTGGSTTPRRSRGSSASSSSPAGARSSPPPRFTLPGEVGSASPIKRGSPLKRVGGFASVMSPASQQRSSAVGAGKRIGMNDFVVLRVLGQGHFGKVLLAEKKGTKQLAALKCIKKVQKNCLT